MRFVLLVTLLLLPIPTASEALELCAKADLRGPDPTAPRNNSPIKLREQCKSPKEVSIGSTADLAKVQANEAAIANKADQSAVDANTSAIAGKADQSAVDANTSAIGANATAIAEKADQSAVDANTSAIAGKADQSALDALAAAVAGNTSDIADNASDVATESGRIDALEELLATPTPAPTPTPTPEPTPTPVDSCLAGAEWNEHGDGTVTQCSTGLIWEMKTDDDSVHDMDNGYSWSASDQSWDNGPLFTVFFAQLNTAPGFAGHTGWRLPTIEELAGIPFGGPMADGGIVDLSAPGCGSGSPCTTIPGETAPSYYWSSETQDSGFGYPDSASVVNFSDGATTGYNVSYALRVRAVRDPS